MEKSKPKIVYIQDVSLSYFEYCLKRARNKREKKELREAIRQFKGRG